MNVWHNLPAQGKCWRFVRIVESEAAFNEPMDATIAACTALWPVVQPLSVTLEMAARLRELPYIELDIPLPVRTWHLREVDVPAHVEVAARVQASEYSEEAIPQLTLQKLAHWLARAHAQQLAEGYVPVLYGLEMHYTRARIIEYQKTYAELAFGPETYIIPVEKRQDGLWVSGPMRNTMINPPIKITIDNNDGRLTLSICVGWSPWTEAGSAEATLLTACLQDVGRQGWDEYC